MSFYQLVLRNRPGETDHVVLVDNQDASDFAYCGQTLEDGALIESIHGQGAIYVVVEQRVEDGVRQVICEQLDDGTLDERLPPVRSAMAVSEQGGFFERWRDASHIVSDPLFRGSLPDIRLIALRPPFRPPWARRIEAYLIRRRRGG